MARGAPLPRAVQLTGRPLKASRRSTQHGVLPPMPRTRGPRPFGDKHPSGCPARGSTEAGYQVWQKAAQQCGELVYRSHTDVRVLRPRLEAWARWPLRHCTDRTGGAGLCYTACGARHIPNRHEQCVLFNVSISGPTTAQQGISGCVTLCNSIAKLSRVPMRVTVTLPDPLIALGSPVYVRGQTDVYLLCFDGLLGTT